MAKEKDKRYTRLNQLIVDGRIQSLTEIFDIVPKTVIANDMKISGDRFNNKLEDIQRFSIGEFYKLVTLLEIDANLVFMLFNNHFQARKHLSARKPKKKSSR